jgi:hypothetical protein
MDDKLIHPGMEVYVKGYRHGFIQRRAGPSDLERSAGWPGRWLVNPTESYQPGQDIGKWCTAGELMPWGTRASICEKLLNLRKCIKWLLSGEFDFDHD